MERGFLLMAITETKTKYGQVHGVQKDGDGEYEVIE